MSITALAAAKPPGLSLVHKQAVQGLELTQSLTVKMAASRTRKVSWAVKAKSILQGVRRLCACL